MGFLPFFSTPITDVIQYITPTALINYPQEDCIKIQLKLGDCIEAYGVEKGRTRCADLYYDFCECRSHALQKERYKAIQKERMRQYQAGKRKTPFEEHPPLDSYYFF